MATKSKQIIPIGLVVGLFLLITACGSMKQKEEQGAAKVDTTKAEMPQRIRPEEMAPPVGSPKFAPSTAGVMGEVIALQQSGGEYRFRLRIDKVVGTGSGTPRLSNNQELELTYPIDMLEEQMQEKKIYRILLSYTPSITEGGEQWFCEKVGDF